jgi:hypothetical protein
VAETGKKLLDLLAVTRWTRDFLVSKDQDLKILFAFHTVIFEDGHFLLSPYLYFVRSLLFPSLTGERQINCNKAE